MLMMVSSSSWLIVRATESYLVSSIWSKPCKVSTTSDPSLLENSLVHIGSDWPLGNAVTCFGFTLLSAMQVL